MKLIDGDELLERVRSRMIRDPEYDLYDVECDIDDSEEVEIDTLVTYANAFSTGVLWALGKVKNYVSKLEKLLGGGNDV